MKIVLAEPEEKSRSCAGFQAEQDSSQGKMKLSMRNARIENGWTVAL
ncbi:MAG: hypothetical protein REI12_13585 [Pedobacter sp.]|nr:hypothetical protein [Pedobacter sp.]